MLKVSQDENHWKLLYMTQSFQASQQVIEWIRLHHESVTGRDGYSDFYKKNITFNVLDLLVIKLKNGN